MQPNVWRWPCGPPRLLDVTLADMTAKDCKKDILIVDAMSNLPDKVNVAVLWALSAEVL